MDNIQAKRNQRRLDGVDEVRRFNGFKSFHNLVVVLLMFVEPISNILASFTHQGRHLVDSFVQWIAMYLESFGQHGRQVPICKRRVRSRDLKSVRFLGQGFSGFIYETTWSTWYGKEKLGRFARKDFPGVECKIFENEAARLVNLDHPNVVKAFCWTVDRLGCSLVLEFVNNDLQSVVETRKEAQRKVSAFKDPLRSGKSVNGTASPFELVEEIYIMLHIATAMEYLHSEGVAHGDLRPNNVLVNLEIDPMIVKVVDFGLIESKKRTTLVSKRAQFLQTLEWKAPETCKIFLASLNESSDEYPWAEMDIVQAEGSVSAADELADVYSFAITCAYIMGGKVSYPKSSSTGLQQNISSGSLRPEIPSTCPEPLKELIESSWDHDPKKRPRFSYLREQLENLQREEPEREQFFTPLMKPNKTQQFHTVLCHIPHQHRSLEFDAKQQRSTVIEEPWTISDHNKVFWSELEISEPDSAHELTLMEENLETFGNLKKEWGHFFLDNVDTVVVGKKITQGGQSEIFVAHWPDREGAMLDCDGVVLKVYRAGVSLRQFQEQWPIEFLKYVDHANKVGSWNPRLGHIFGGLLLKNGRFAFAMERYWGDMRSLIDNRMLKQRQPFTTLVAKRIMLEIAEGMRFLHELGIIHRDLKASNVFIKLFDTIHGDPKASNILTKSPDKFNDALENDAFSCVLGDFECSIGVVGTGFWRAPEILLAVKNREFEPTLTTRKTDVYSYSMTCYEILTGLIPFWGFDSQDFDVGKIPFRDLPWRDYNYVISGGRPELPPDIDPAIKTLVCRCWHPDPLERPTFEEICEALKIMM